MPDNEKKKLNSEENRTAAAAGSRSDYGLNAAIAGYILGNCSTAYYCNLSDRTVRILQRSGLVSEELEKSLMSVDDGIMFYVNNHVHPDDRQAVKEWLEPSAVRKTLETAQSSELVFRDISETGAGTYRGTILGGEDADHVIILFRNITDVIRAEKQRTDRERLNNELINRMMGGDGLFIIDCVNNTRKTFYNHCYGAENYSDDESYSESIAKYIESFVSEPDRKMMRKLTNADYMIERCRMEKEYSTEYKDVSTGVPRYYEMHIAGFSDTEVLQSFVNRDDEILDRMFFSKLESNYLALFAADLDTDTARVMKKSPLCDIGEEGSSVPYADSLMAFSGNFKGETREFFEKISSADYIRKRFADEDEATFVYRARIEGVTKWLRASGMVISRHKDGMPSVFALGFSIMDTLASEKAELQHEIREKMEIIGGLASEYHSLYYINLNDNSFKVYSLDENRLSDTKVMIEGGRDGIALIQKFAHSPAVHPDDRHRFDGLTKEGIIERLSGRKKFTVRFRRNYGEGYLWSVMDVVKYEAADERANAIAVGFAERDKEIRNEAEQKKKLEQALVAAEAANISKNSFLFNMSHDLRTPMNAIKGFTTMAKKYADDREKLTDYLDKIDVSGQQLLTLINQVLEMSNIESGKVEFDEKPMDVRENFYSMVTVLSPQAKARDISFNYTLSNVSNPRVIADEGRMGQIMLNVAVNALKYTPEGGRVDFALEEIPAEKEGYGRYRFTVSDNGIGMSREYLSKLYEPFSREKNSTMSHVQGTGLGLTIVKELVDRLGGSIDVSSEPGKGTKFDITVDLKLCGENTADAKDDSAADAVSFEGRRVLVVEDNEMNREIAKDILEEHGFVVEEAEDGIKAVEMVQATADRREYSYYDIILMDIQMPGMNGYEATRAIRAIPSAENTRIPIIAMTANAFEEDRQNAIAAGMNEHLEKPIDVPKLLETMARFL